MYLYSSWVPYEGFCHFVLVGSAILGQNTYIFAVFQMHRPQDLCGVRCEDNRRDEGQRHPRGFEPHPAGPAGGGDPQEAPGTSVHHTTGRVVPGMLTIAAFSS